jgi:hypothetical protein
MAVLISVTEGDVTQVVLADVGVQGATGPSSPASGTPFTPYGNIAATNVQTAIQELDDEKFGKAGGTVTGNLEIGTGGTLSFEGATADGFETTLAVVDPTADRTLTLPNVTGTFVTTGDTGTVTSTMLLDGTILNADVNASAAIAGTKISPDFGSQTIVTTGVYSAAAGSAAAPSIAFTGDTNTGIYSPGADQVAISTSGTGRLFVQADGDVSIGQSAGNSQLVVKSSTSLKTVSQFIAFDTVTTTMSVWERSDGAVSSRLIYDGTGLIKFGTSTAHALTLDTSDTERARIDSSGSLLVGTSTSTGYGELLRVEKASTGTEGAGIRFGGTYSIADETTQTFNVGNGCLIFVSENNLGDGALFFCGYKSAIVTLIADPNSRYAIADVPTKICVFKSANSNTVSLKNRTGGTRSFTIGKINNSD